MKKLCDCGVCRRCKHREYTRLWKLNHPEGWKAIAERAYKKRTQQPDYKSRRREEYLRNRARYIERAKNWQKENPSAVNAKNAKWKRENREQVNASERRRLAIWSPERRSERNFRSDTKKLYNTTPEWYGQKLEEQGGKCAICGADSPGAKNRQRFYIDHCHASGENRGLLCHKCNVGLVRFEDLPNWADKALAYLAHYKEQSMTTVPHPSGGEYNPDHIQTPKEMPPVTQPAPELEPAPIPDSPEESLDAQLAVEAPADDPSDAIGGLSGAGVAPPETEE